MAGHEHLARVAAISGDIVDYPSCHRCGIVDTIVERGIGQQAIVGRYHHIIAAGQLRRYKFVASGKASAVKPYNHRQSCRFIGRMKHIGHAAHAGIGVAHVVLCNHVPGRGRQQDAKQNKQH